MEPIPEELDEGESSEATLLDDFTMLSPQIQVMGGQAFVSSEHMEQCSSGGNSHPPNMASPPISSEFDLLVMSPDLELQERNYLRDNEEPSSLESLPSPTLGLVTQEPGQSSHQAEISSTQPNQPEISLHQWCLLDGGNTSGQQAWTIGGSHSEQSSPICQPQSLVPCRAMGLGLRLAAPHMTHQQEENRVTCDQTNPYEASSSIPQSGLLDGSNASREQAWETGGNHPDQSWPISRPQTPFPHSSMELGVGHGRNDFDQTLPIPRPFPHIAMGLGGPHWTDQQQENWVTFNRTPYQASSGIHHFIGEAPSIPNIFNPQYSEAHIRFHQVFDESPIIPIALDAQNSSSLTSQNATSIWWSRAMSQQQINDQVLMDASNASAHAAVNESLLLPETSVPNWQSRYRGQHVQQNQLPLLDLDPQSHYSTMHETSMMIGPQHSASFQPVNQASIMQNFVDNSEAGTLFLPAESSIPHRVPFTSPPGFPNGSPPVIPNSNIWQSQFMNPEMDGGSYYIGNPYHLRTMDSYSEQGSRKRCRFGDSTYEEGQSSSSAAKHFRLDENTQEPSHPWLNFGHVNTSYQPQWNNSGGTIDNFGRIMNRVYDPMYERLGLAVDPQLRMFLASQHGNPSSFGQTATSQSHNQPYT